MDTNLEFHLSSTDDTSPTENEQYFVMQNDNDTLTISRQPVQFLTQVPAENGTLLQSKPRFIQQQGYYIQDTSAFIMSDCLVSNNAEEAEPSNEDFLMQNAAESSDLQSQETMNTNENITNDEMDVTDVADTDILGMANGTTEITLNQEQWEMLEQNGWVLLELNSKIYLLDTLGLHDISDNADLIQSLKNELGFSTQELEQAENTTQDISLQVHEENVRILQLDNSSSETSKLKGKLDAMKAVEVPGKEAKPVNKLQTRKFIWKKNGVMRFKTNIKLEEIPEKLVLGTTVNGKRLVAKVVKKPKPIKKLPDTNIPPPVKAIGSSQIPGNTDSEKARVDQYFKHFLRNMLTPPESEDIQKAESIINQLLCIHSTRDRLIKQNILVTRNSVPTTAAETPPQPVHVSGYVVNAGRDKWCFQQEKHLLQRIMSQKLNKGISQWKDAIVHVHIEESNQSEEGLTKTSITINKQNIRLLPMQPRKLVHACADCANLFETEDDVKEHRKKPCTNHITNPDAVYSSDILDYYTVKPKEGLNQKTYVCKMCNMMIAQRALKTHVTSHTGPKLPLQPFGYPTAEYGPPHKAPNLLRKKYTQNQLHKCTMCPNVCYHKSTLSKHFLNCHVKNNYQKYYYQN